MQHNIAKVVRSTGDDQSPRQPFVGTLNRQFKERLGFIEAAQSDKAFTPAIVAKALAMSGMVTPDSFTALLTKLKAGVGVKPGPQSNRQLSAPASGPKTLLKIEG